MAGEKISDAVAASSCRHVGNFTSHPPSCCLGARRPSSTDISKRQRVDSPAARPLRARRPA